jgi:hypothetical protein
LSIQIPASVVTIDHAAFVESKLEQLTFEPNSRPITIGEAALRQTRLKSIEIPASVETIGEWAFQATPLTSVTFEQGSKLRFIGYNAFSDTALTSFTLPATPVRSGYAFTGWSQNESGGTSIENLESLALQGSQLFALWAKTSFTVNFNTTSGSSVDSVQFQSGVLFKRLLLQFVRVTISLVGLLPMVDLLSLSLTRREFLRTSLCMLCGLRLLLRRLHEMSLRLLVIKQLLSLG